MEGKAGKRPQNAGDSAKFPPTLIAVPRRGESWWAGKLKLELKLQLQLDLFKLPKQPINKAVELATIPGVGRRVESQDRAGESPSRAWDIHGALPKKKKSW